MGKKKEYTPLEVTEILRKSLYKMVAKTLRNVKDKTTYKESASKVIADVLDPNYIAEVDPDEIPEKKDGVLWKNKKKGVNKLKKFKKSQRKIDKNCPSKSK